MSYASPDSLLQPSNAEEGYGLHAPFIARLPSFIDDQAKAHLARRATTPFAQKRRAAINERAATILKSPDAVPKFLLDLVATGEWDILGDITARDGGPPEIWEPPWEGQEQWEQNPDRDMSGGSFFKRTITNPTRLSRLFAIHDPLNLVVLIYVRVGQDLCGHPSIIHGGFSAALMDELLGMLCWESFHVPLFTATLTIDYRKPVGLVDEWDGKKCKEMWGCAYITEKKGRKTFARADLMDLPDKEGVVAEPVAPNKVAANGTPDLPSPYGKEGVPDRCTVRVEANGLWVDMKGRPAEHVEK